MTSLKRGWFLPIAISHLDSIYNFALWLCRDAEEAEEIVHDTLAKVLSNGFPGMESNNEVRTYLFAAIRRVHGNRCRRLRHGATSAGYPEDENPVSTPFVRNGNGNLPRDGIKYGLEKALAKLPGEARALVLLVDIEGFSPEECGRILGLPVGTVKSDLSRTRQSLRNELNGYLESPVR